MLSRRVSLRADRVLWNNSLGCRRSVGTHGNAASCICSVTLDFEVNMNTSRPPGPGAGTDSLARSSSSGDHTSAPLQPSLGGGTFQAGSQSGQQGDGQSGSVAASLTKDMKEAAQTAARAVKQQA